MVTTGFADLSHHQAGVDLGAYARAGHDRVFMKATQGTTGIDPMFAARWKAAGQLGLARGAYHFAEAADNGAADFDHFIGVVTAAGGLAPGDLLCLDSEDPAATSRADEHAREFTARAVQRGFPDGCLYTGRWYADPANLRPDDLAPGWRRLWISDYGPAPDGAISLPAGWTRDQVIARQYTDAATVTGVAGPCDANRVLREWTNMPLTDADTAAVAKRLAGDDAFLYAVRVQLITALSDPTHHYLQDELQPLKDGESSVLGALNAVAADVAAVKTAQAAGGVDLAGLAAQLAPLLVPTLADGVAVELAKRLAS